MSRRIPEIAVLGLVLAITVACTNKKSVNPLANLGSKQPDKVLFDKAMDAMRHNRFDVARLTLQTLINTYPDSEYIARAKLAVGDSWYAEGGTAALAQAEQEYSDFEIFFPNMAEAAEAQLKIANIHYQQMEKADRDYTHAKRAEDEYRKMILQYPDSKLVPEAKVRLLEVQEVLGEREFEVGRFYYLRQSYPASIARLQSLVEKYPLYSRADEALYLLGQDYEGQIARLRSAPRCDEHGLPRGCATEAVKGRYIGELSKKAGQSYSQILTRYPLMDRSDDARKRLAALKQPIPRPTRGEVARNRAELASRSDASVVQKALGLVKKGPDTSGAAKVGEPSLADPEPVAATSVIRSETYAAAGISEKSVGVEIVKPDQPAADATGATGTGAAGTPGTDATAMGGSTFGKTPASGVAPLTSDPNELKPTANADPNELKPTDATGDQALPPPVQVNEIQQGSSSAVASADNTPASDAELSSSKKKRKKGLQKIVPF
ncbi:MAG TPA: outer membrane protein assembly factor BamD [Candidatus Sulfotelmatobacter sp.]|jgi:outer membrane protein assembly factor BamD|nr:outer membrane protein assembly factor BamD [Candidatus Sulfotelmatobacter sp.]